jgi:EAL domain-containing protein (putative c-di-GMP-specific phosphodiesterase class I)
MLTHAPSALIVRAIIGLGRSLGLTIVAEGVETREQLDDLRRWGCDQVQGYLIGKPMIDDHTAGQHKFMEKRHFDRVVTALPAGC